MSENPDQKDTLPAEGSADSAQENPTDRLHRLLSDSQPVQPPSESVDEQADTQPYRVNPPAEPLDDLPVLNEVDPDLVQTIGIPADPGGVPLVPPSEIPDLVQTIPMAAEEDWFNFAEPESQNPSVEEPGATRPNIYLSNLEAVGTDLDDDSNEPTIPPPPGLGGNELPRRVEEQDLNATRVTPAAYNSPRAERPVYQSVPTSKPSSGSISRRMRGHTEPNPASSSTRPTRPVNPPMADYTRPTGAHPPRGQHAGRRKMGCFWRGVVILLFIGVILFLLVASIGVFQYFRIASTLPDVSELRQRASQFETTRIYDRNGNVLYEINDPNAGRPTYVPLSQISPYLVATTIST